MAVRAVVVKLWRETPSVQGVRLQLLSERPEFHAGQWVDFIVPTLAAIGGYSVTDYTAAGTIDLCVKLSQHPCASWVHDRAQVGDEVSVRFGGSFKLVPDSHARPCLFVAGGIGITPLVCILAQLAEQRRGQQEQAGARPLLLYSARNPDEFACLSQLLQLQCDGRLDLHLFTTKQHGTPPALQQSHGSTGQGGLHVHRGRMCRADLQAALQQQGTDALAYVCGPPAMAEQVLALLQEAGVPPGNLHTEKWW